MTNRLVEAHYLAHKDDDYDTFMRFWLTESFDLAFLNTLVRRFPSECEKLQQERSVVGELMEGQLEKARTALQDERRAIEIEDEKYWAPLVKELQHLRSVHAQQSN